MVLDIREVARRFYHSYLFNLDKRLNLKGLDQGTQIRLVRLATVEWCANVGLFGLLREYNRDYVVDYFVNLWLLTP